MSAARLNLVSFDMETQVGSILCPAVEARVRACPAEGGGRNSARRISGHARTTLWLLVSARLGCAARWHLSRNRRRLLSRHTCPVTCPPPPRLLWLHGRYHHGRVRQQSLPFAAVSDDDLVELVKHLAACQTSFVSGAHPVAGGVRRAQAVSPRRLFLTLHLLHTGAASVGSIRIQPNRNCTSSPAVSDRARGTRTRRPHADCRPSPRAAFDACKSRRSADGRAAQEQAGRFRS